MKWIVKTLIWAVVFAALIILCSCATTSYLPFAGHTKNKPLQGRMTQQQWRQTQLGRQMYTRFAGKQIKNTNRVQQLKRH
jgi:hypothetical protein